MSIIMCACVKCGVVCCPQAVRPAVEDEVFVERCPIPGCGGTVIALGPAVRRAAERAASDAAGLAGLDEVEQIVGAPVSPPLVVRAR